MKLLDGSLGASWLWRMRTFGVYGDFLALWKDTDPGIPILKQAKDECA